MVDRIGAALREVEGAILNRFDRAILTIVQSDIETRDPEAQSSPPERSTISDIPLNTPELLQAKREFDSSVALLRELSRFECELRGYNSETRFREALHSIFFPGKVRSEIMRDATPWQLRDYWDILAGAVCLEQMKHETLGRDRPIRYLHHREEAFLSPFGATRNDRDALIRLNAHIQGELIEGATICIRGLVDPEFVKWASGGGPEQRSPIAYLQIVYEFPLPSGAFYPITLKAASGNKQIGVPKSHEYPPGDHAVIIALSKALEQALRSGDLSLLTRAPDRAAALGVPALVAEFGKAPSLEAMEEIRRRVILALHQPLSTPEGTTATLTTPAVGSPALDRREFIERLKLLLPDLPGVRGNPRPEEYQVPADRIEAFIERYGDFLHRLHLGDSAHQEQENRNLARQQQREQQKYSGPRHGYALREEFRIFDCISDQAKVERFRAQEAARKGIPPEEVTVPAHVGRRYDLRFPRIEDLLTQLRSSPPARHVVTTVRNEKTGEVFQVEGVDGVRSAQERIETETMRGIDRILEPRFAALRERTNTRGYQKVVYMELDKLTGRSDLCIDIPELVSSLSFRMTEGKTILSVLAHCYPTEHAALELLISVSESMLKRGAEMRMPLTPPRTASLLDLFTHFGAEINRAENAEKRSIFESTKQMKLPPGDKKDIVDTLQRDVSERARQLKNQLSGLRTYAYNSLGKLQTAGTTKVMAQRPGANALISPGDISYHSISVVDNRIAKFIYVITADGEMIIERERLSTDRKRALRPTHSQLAGGQTVYAAGEIIVGTHHENLSNFFLWHQLDDRLRMNDGLPDSEVRYELIEINNLSGHYLPPGSECLAYARTVITAALRKLGVGVDGVRVENRLLTGVQFSGVSLIGW